MFGGGLPVELQNKDRLEPSFTVLLSLYDVILGGTWRKEYDNVWLWYRLTITMKKLFKVTIILKGSGKQLQYIYIYIMYCAIAIVFNAVNMSSSFTLLHLDFISCLLRNKKYYSQFTSLEIFPVYLGYSIKYKFCYSARCKFLVFLFLQQQKAEKRRKFLPRKYVTIKRNVRGGET